MHLYRLSIAPDINGGDGEGEDHDEWFSSLRAARRRRSELIREWKDAWPDHPYGEDFSVHKVTFQDLPKKALLLQVLHRVHYLAASWEEVVPPFTG